MTEERESAGMTSMPPTAAASEALSMGTTIPRMPIFFASMAMLMVPLMGRSRPSSASSPANIILR